MAITSLAQYDTAKKQIAIASRVSNVVTVASTFFSNSNGTLAGTNTANGVVPDGTDNAESKLDGFAAGATGYLTNLTHSNVGANQASNIGILFDMVFRAGAYSFNSAVTLASQPSYASRMPGGTDFTNTELWFECVTAFTGNVTITVTYTNESGVAGRTTNLTSYGAVAPTVRRALRFPLQSGDTGVSKIESVTSTVATVGTFNILVLRRLAMARQSNTEAFSPKFNWQDMFQLGMPVLFNTSRLYQITLSGSTSGGQPYSEIEVVSG